MTRRPREKCIVHEEELLFCCDCITELRDRMLKQLDKTKRRALFDDEDETTDVVPYNTLLAIVHGETKIP